MKKGLAQLLAYIFLNILVSAAAMLLVLTLWNQKFPSTICPPCILPVGISTTQLEKETQNPAASIPPLEQEVLRIEIIYGSGYLQDEQIILQRVSEGDLYMAGWYLIDEEDNRYDFPAQLVLKPGAEVELNSRAGQDTAVELFWNAGSALWQEGETARVYDPLGNLRAEFTIP